MNQVGSDDTLAGSRVLVVEDDASLGAGLVAVLAGAGHEVRWARTAADARRLITDACPELVLLDLGLPDADGLEVCREIDGGADDVVLKPFRPVELLAASCPSCSRPSPARAASADRGGPRPARSCP